MLRRKNPPKLKSKPTQAQAPKKKEKQTKFLKQFRQDTKVSVDNIGVGVDLGTRTLVIVVCEVGQLQIVECPIEGFAINTLVFLDPDTNEIYCGEEALNRAPDNPAFLAKHIKRNLALRPREKLYFGGTKSAIEVTTMLLNHAFKVLVNARPDLEERLAPGYSGSPSVRLVFTTPADWGIEEHAVFEEAIRGSRFGDLAGFIAEPSAAARYITKIPRIRLQNGQTILCIDLGGGTLDITLTQYKEGGFDQLCKSSGDGLLGGNDFTAVLAQWLAKQAKIPWVRDIYGPGGLDIAKAKPADRASILEIWTKAEQELKPRLALMESVDVTLNLPTGRKRVSMPRATAEGLWKTLFAKFREHVAKSLDDSELSFEDVDYVLLVGGAAAMHSIASHVAQAIGRPEKEVTVGKDSVRVVAEGAAEHGYFQRDNSQALPGGLGFKIRLPEGDHQNTLFIEDGQIFTADGFYVDKTGFYIEVADGATELEVEPFSLKKGVHAELVDGQDTNVADSEVVHLTPIRVSIDHWPNGIHDVEIGVTSDPNRNMVMLVRPEDLPEVEVLAIPLTSGAESQSTNTGLAPLPDIVLILDASGSMVGEKIAELIKGALDYVDKALAAGHRVGILPYPAGTQLKPTTDAKKLQHAIKSLAAGGGTPTAEALVKAKEWSARSEQAVGVLYTDGHPNCRPSAFKAAKLFRKQHRLICVGIGRDVCKADLLQMASTREDYIDVAEGAKGIAASFKKVAARIQARPSTAQPTSPKTGKPQSKPEPESWDDIEGIDGEVA